MCICNHYKKTNKQTWQQEFCQIWNWWWNISNNISFHFRSFPGKTEYFKKSKNPIWEPFLALFAQIWGKMNFPGKKGSEDIVFLTPLSAWGEGGLKIFIVGKKWGICTVWIFKGEWVKRGSAFFQGAEDFLKAIFNCWSNIT